MVVVVVLMEARGLGERVKLPAIKSKARFVFICHFNDSSLLEERVEVSV